MGIMGFNGPGERVSGVQNYGTAHGSSRLIPVAKRVGLIVANIENSMHARHLKHLLNPAG
jgi:hypothetical protein